MAPLKITNPRIAVELVRELANEPAFNLIKAFSAAHLFLRRVMMWGGKEGNYVTIPASKIKEWFESYGIKYKQCLDALESHDLIKIDRQYIVGVKTRGYRLTKKGVEMMSVGEMRYLKKLFADPVLKRKIQKNESYHRNNGKTYESPLLQHIHNGRMRYQFSEDAMTMIEQRNWSKLSKLKATTDLIGFKERDFVELRWNEADSRCFNEFVGMKRELRQHFRLGKLHYRYVMDIRSCHPSFLAHYLVHHARMRNSRTFHPIVDAQHYRPIVVILAERERDEIANSSHHIPTPINLPPSILSIPPESNTTSSTNQSNLQYDGGNSDIRRELARWNQMFFNPEEDPRAVLMRELEYSREQAKRALNESINGGKTFRKFIGWFERTFPLLHGVWTQSDMWTVGNEISTLYEFEAMQYAPLYARATELGLHLTYEYDGCGVMCRDDDDEVLEKIQQLIALIQARGEHLWGLRPVIVVKTALGEAVAMPANANNRAAERPETGPVTSPPASTPTSHTAASASQRSPSRSSRPSRRRRE